MPSNTTFQKPSAASAAAPACPPPPPPLLAPALLLPVLPLLLEERAAGPPCCERCGTLMRCVTLRMSRDSTCSTEQYRRQVGGWTNASSTRCAFPQRRSATQGVAHLNPQQASNQSSRRHQAVRYAVRYAVPNLPAPAAGGTAQSWCTGSGRPAAASTAAAPPLQMAR